MRYNRWLLSFAVLMAAFIAPRVQAAPIAYHFSGIASGSINGTNFFNAPYQMSLLTVTDDIASSGPNTLRTASSVLDFTINGTAGTFNTPFTVFRTSNGGASTAGLTEVGGGDLMSIKDASLAAYDLASSFGPITQTPPNFVNALHPYATSAGTLIFQPEPPGSITFQAVLNPTLVPVPGAFGLLASALGGLFLLRRRSA